MWSVHLRCVLFVLCGGDALYQQLTSLQSQDDADVVLRRENNELRARLVELGDVTKTFEYEVCS